MGPSGQFIVLPVQQINESDPDSNADGRSK